MRVAREGIVCVLPVRVYSVRVACEGSVVCQ